MTPAGNPAPPTVSVNANNQIAGQTYDQAGNQLSVNGNTLQYDPEGKVLYETDGISHNVETYVYDGDGRRVMKYGPNRSPATTFVYDAHGRMAAEYSTAPNTSPCTTCYLSADNLGTTRLVTDANANVIARHDYLPFGEEVLANTFGRRSESGPYADTVNQKFTGKERDSESGLDYFGARYYASAMGRWTSPDQPFADQHIEDPQSWNMYGYVRNNPLVTLIRMERPAPHSITAVASVSGQICTEIWTPWLGPRLDFSPLHPLHRRNLRTWPFQALVPWLRPMILGRFWSQRDKRWRSSIWNRLVKSYPGR